MFKGFQHSKKRAALFLLMVLFPWLASAAGGAPVLCLEVDGSLQLESSHLGGDCPDELDQQGSAPAFAVDHSVPIPHLDVPLVAEQVSKRAPQHTCNAQCGLSNRLAYAYLQSRHTPQPCTVEPYPVHPDRAALRSIVLLN